ncbi:hypothetical protein QTP88_028703 [Uroleucon formosanum]
MHGERPIRTFTGHIPNQKYHERSHHCDITNSFPYGIHVTVKKTVLRKNDLENPFFQPNRNRIMILGPVGHPFSSRRFRNIMSEPKLLFATYILLPFQIYELYDGHQRVI